MARPSPCARTPRNRSASRCSSRPTCSSSAGSTSGTGWASSSTTPWSRSQASGTASRAARSAGDTLTKLATPLGWAVTLGPILLVLVIWLPRRWRFARRAGEAAEMAAAPAGEQLLALRALANRPLQELRRVAPDPVRAWRDGDADAVHALAQLELVADGVRRRPTRIGARPLTPS